jgi:hypothetical protein
MKAKPPKPKPRKAAGRKRESRTAKVAPASARPYRVPTGDIDDERR